jgi:hypothetical protein
MDKGKKAGAEQWQIAVRGNAAANAAAVKVAHASPAVTTPKSVTVVVLELALVGA